FNAARGGVFVNHAYDSCAVVFLWQYAVSGFLN
ncbi:MAG: hypothetical protein ACI8Z5_000078, partial [Lentimonas sp.]